MTASGQFTIDGTGTGGATVYVIDTDASPSTVVGTTTTNADGTWSVDVGSDTTIESILEYEDPDTGEVYKVLNKPYVTHTSPAPTFFDEALHRYEFAEGSGSTVADTGSAGSLADLELYNGPSWTTDAVHEGWAIALDGTDDYGRAPNRDTMSGFTEGMTFLCWAKLEQVDSRVGIATCYDTTNDERSWYFEQNSLNDIRVYYSANGADFYRDIYSTFDLYNEWVRLGFRWSSGSNINFLINGTAYAPDTADTNVSSLYQTSSPLDLGRATHSTDRYLSGQLDDTMLWDRALTDSEVQEDYDYYTS